MDVHGERAREPAASRRGWRGVLRETLILQWGQALLVVIQAAASLLLLRMLGPVAFGVYSLGAAVATFAGLADVTAWQRLAAIDGSRAVAAASATPLATVLGPALRVGLAVNATISGLLFLAASAFPDAVFGDARVGDLARWLGLMHLVEVPSAVAIAALRVTRRAHGVVRLESVRALVTALSSVGAVAAGFGVQGMVLGRLAGAVAGEGWAAWVYRKACAHDPRLPTWGAMFSAMREPWTSRRFSAGAAMAVEKNTGELASQLPVLVLGWWSPADVGYYSAGLRIVTLPVPLLSAFARALEVELAGRAAAGAGEVRAAFTQSTLIAGLAWSVVTLVTVSVAPLVLVVLAGQGYEPSIPVVRVLALQQLATGFGIGIGVTLRVLDRVWVLAWCQAIALAVAAPIGYWLVGAAGAAGAAWFHGLRVSIFTALGIAGVLRTSTPERGASGR